MKKHLVFTTLIFFLMYTCTAQVAYNMNLLDQWDDSGLSYNDCWGYVDGSNNEYAILGSYSKIHFFQITSNDDLVLIDEFTPGATSVWRDFKTYGNYAYAVTEGNEGLLVYDLSNLPTSVSLSHEITSEFTRAHNIYVDELNGTLYVAGSNTQSNGLIIYDVTTNPPTHLASVSLPGGGYVHDLYVKNDTAYCSHGNNGYFIWDVSTPSSPSFLASFTGEQGYNHSSWVTPDGNTAFYAREVGVGLPMTALDISDLNDLEVLSNFKYPLLAPTHVDNVPHNPYLVGNYLYTSYYEDGVQVFDVSDPLNVTQAAYYDTYPSNNSYNGYEGCWGVYPFLPSGRILASDDINGLFLLELDISSNPPLVLNIINQTDVLCNGENTGSIEVEGVGGVPPYTYSLDGGTPQTSGIFSNLFAGTYTLSTTDAVGVVNNTPIIISEPVAIFPIISLIQNVTCFGDSDGSITAQASGGTVTSSYQYSIDGTNFSPNNTFTNLSGGPYTLSVRDDNNCIATIGFNINEPDELLSFVNTLTNVDCFGNNNGEVSFFTLGGTPSYSFSINQIDFQPTANFNNLSGGNYTLYTIDAQGCQSQTPFTITEPPLLQIAITQQTNLNCFGENIGEVILNGQGGTPNYEYNINNGSYQSSATFSNLSEGNYDFNIKDANGCIVTINTTITSPPELLVGISQLTNVNCFGENTGSVSIDISGGGGNYSSTLNGNIQMGSSIEYQNLSAGNYSVSIEDGNGCTENLSFEITENPEFEIFPFNIQNPSCNNSNDGVIEIFPLGGSGPFSYFINNIPSGSNPVFENLGGGIYNISAVDNLGCEATTQFELVEPSAIIVNIVSLNDVSCGGNNNGSVTISGSGGVGVLQYILNGTINTNGVFNNLGAGNYTVVVSDENDCVEGINFTISAPQNISAQVINQTNIDCNGNMTGSFQVTASGGNSNYIFDIGTTSNSTGFFENLGAGFYNISITDGDNCQTTISTELTEPAIIISNIVSVQDVICFGQNNGSIQITASGGTGALNFTLGNETNTTGFFENLSSGTYNISITDSNSCQSSIAAQISEPTTITSNINSTQGVTCFGQNNGSVQVGANGGTGTLNFTLGNETNTTGFFENLSSGTYNILITDSNSCQSSIAAQISEPTAITSNINSTQDVTCFGENNGSVQVSASGGTGTLNFILGNETNTTGFFENLSSGTYNISITDSNNCQSSIAAQISEPTAITSNINSTQDVTCFGENNGSVQVSANGGTGVLNFTLGNETNTTGFFENLPSGNYNILITDSNNCQSSIAAQISEPTAITSNINSTQDVECFGQNNGSVQVAANGGTGTLNYTLGNETNTTGFFENLPSGNYNISITDSNNCQSSIATQISEPTLLTIAATNIELASCNGQQGAIQVEAQGGTGPFQFSNGSTNNANGLFENLMAGIYLINVTDANNCSANIEVNITEPNAINIEVLQSQNPNCHGENSGTIQLNAIGGTGAVNYALGNETNNSGLFENLSAGIYNIIITDNNNCASQIEIELVDPPLLEIEINQIIKNNCFGDANGSIALSATGGTGALNFSMGNETNTSGIFGNLPAGDYSVLVSDENNCQSTLPFSITEPPILTANISQNTPVGCSGEMTGAVQFNAEGGTGNYFYSMEGVTNSTGLFENLSAGNFIMNLTDDNGCSFSQEVTISEPTPLILDFSISQTPICNGDFLGLALTATGGVGNYQFSINNETNSSGDFSNLLAGTYNALVTDGNNCTSGLEITVNEPPAITITTTQVQMVDCNGNNSGSVSLTASGGTGALQFSLNNESNSTGEFENLTAGIYEVEVLDENNCSSLIEFEITEPQLLEINLGQVQSVNCNGEATGFIQVNAMGGSGNIQFSLNNETNNSGLFENLPVGTYEVVAIDNNNCTSTTSVIITEPDSISIEITDLQEVICFGENNGSVILLAEGGNGTFNYTLGNETNADGVFENLTSGTYDINILDGNNCAQSITISIVEPQPLQSIVEQTQALSCAGDSSSTIIISGSGGIGNLQYTLNNNTNTSGVFENLPAGTYTYSITDENDCVFSSEVIITEPMPFITNVLQNQNLDCFGEPTGVIEVGATGGTSGYTFTLNGNTNTSGVFENLLAGTYEVIISDANDCESIEIITLTEPTELSLTVQNIQPAGCDGAATGSFQVQANGGTGTNYTYMANNQITSDGFFGNISAGVYDCIVTDENDCTSVLQITVNENSDIVLNDLETTDVDCFGLNSGSAQISAGGGVGNLTYALDTINNTTGVFNNLPPGNYNIIVSDAANCSSIFPIEIFEPSAIEAIADTIIAVDCFGLSTGAVHLVASGGVGGYDYFLDGNTSADGWFENLLGGNYNVMAVDSNNCSTSFSIEVFEPSELLIAINNLTNDLGNGEGSVTLLASGGTPDYLYSLDGVNFQSENVFGNLGFGNYTGYVQDMNGCITMTLFEIEMETAISNIELGIQGIEILPNPFSEKIIIQFDLIMPQNLQIELRSVDGKNILQKKSVLGNGQQNVVIDVESNVPDGIYILSIRNEEQVIGHFKMIKN